MQSVEKDYSEVYKGLQTQVDKLVPPSTVGPCGVPVPQGVRSAFTLTNLTLSKTLVYIAMPIIIFIILIVWRPGFVTYSKTDEEGKTETKLSMKAMVIATVIITAIVFGGYVYFSRRR